MSWTPTDEQVEAVARILAAHANPDIIEFEDFWDLVLTQTARDRYRHTARAALVAVGPMIAAQAWQEGYWDGRRSTGEGEDGPRYVNPYSEKEAGR